MVIRQQSLHSFSVLRDIAILLLALGSRWGNGCLGTHGTSRPLAGNPML